MISDDPYVFRVAVRDYFEAEHALNRIKGSRPREEVDRAIHRLRRARSRLVDLAGIEDPE
jgi:hypothetical protein